MAMPNKFLTTPFTNVHTDAVLQVKFLRRFVDGETEMPVMFASVAEYADTVPERMRLEGGFIVPLHYTERLIMEFNSPTRYPFAVKATMGNECVLTGRLKMHGLGQGERRTEELVLPFQNYVMIQFNDRIESRYTGNGHHEPLVAEPYPVMIELEIYPLLADRWVPSEAPKPLKDLPEWMLNPKPGVCVAYAPLFKRINVDGYDLPIFRGRSPKDFDQNTLSRIRLHLVTVMQWEDITGKPIEYAPLTY